MVFSENPAKIGVIFDCDGTLLDSMGMWHGLDDRLAARAGVELTMADRDFLTAATLEECSVYLHERYAMGSSPADVLNDFHEELHFYYENQVQPKPGAVELVNSLASADIPMAVASSTPPSLLRLGLETAGFADVMRAIVSVEDIGSSKREPLVYDMARVSLGTDRAHTWGVEDALYAVRTLGNAGYRTMAVFDSQIAGSPEDLAAAADIYVPSLESVTLELFFA